MGGEPLITAQFIKGGIMELSIMERLMLLNVLPPEGDFVTMKILRELKTELLFSEEEVEKAELVGGSNQTSWKNDFVKDVQIGKVATAAIVDALKKLNDQKKLTEQHLPLYERFTEEEEKE